MVDHVHWVLNLRVERVAELEDTELVIAEAIVDEDVFAETVNINGSMLGWSRGGIRRLGSGSAPLGSGAPTASPTPSFCRK